MSNTDIDIELDTYENEDNLKPDSKSISHYDVESDSLQTTFTSTTISKYDLTKQNAYGTFPDANVDTETNNDIDSQMQNIFERKIYFVLFAQLCIVFGTTIMCIAIEQIKMYLHTNLAAIISSAVLFTISLAMFLGCASAYFDTYTMMFGILVMIMSLSCLMIIGFMCRTDVKLIYSFIIGFVVTIIMFVIFLAQKSMTNNCYSTNCDISTFVYACLGSLIYYCYIVLDVHVIKNDVELYDDLCLQNAFVFATLSVYLDIICLWWYIPEFLTSLIGSCGCGDRNLCDCNCNCNCDDSWNCGDCAGVDG